MDNSTLNAKRYATMERAVIGVAMISIASTIVFLMSPLAAIVGPTIHEPGLTPPDSPTASRIEPLFYGAPRSLSPQQHRIVLRNLLAWNRSVNPTAYNRSMRGSQASEYESLLTARLKAVECADEFMRRGRCTDPPAHPDALSLFARLLIDVESSETRAKAWERVLPLGDQITRHAFFSPAEIAVLLREAFIEGETAAFERWSSQVRSRSDGWRMSRMPGWHTEWLKPIEFGRGALIPYELEDVPYFIVPIDLQAQLSSANGLQYLLYRSPSLSSRSASSGFERLVIELPTLMSPNPPPEVDAICRVILFDGDKSAVATAEYDSGLGYQGTVIVDIPREWRRKRAVIVPVFRTVAGWVASDVALEGICASISWPTAVSGTGYEVPYDRNDAEIHLSAIIPPEKKFLFELASLASEDPLHREVARWDDRNRILGTHVPLAAFTDPVMRFRLSSLKDSALISPWYPLFKDRRRRFFIAHSGITNLELYGKMCHEAENAGRGTATPERRVHDMSGRGYTLRMMPLAQTGGFVINAHEESGDLFASVFSDTVHVGYVEYRSEDGSSGEASPMTATRDLLLDSNETNALGIFIADALRSEVGADIGVMNRTGIRGNLPSIHPEYWTQHVLPFHDEVAVVILTREEVVDLIRRTNAGSTLYDVAVSSSLLPDAQDFSIDENDVSLGLPAGRYSVAVPSYLLQSRLGLEIFSTAPRMQAQQMTTLDAFDRRLHRGTGSHKSR